MENYENILNMLTVAQDLRRLGRIEIFDNRPSLSDLIGMAEGFGLKTSHYYINDRTDLLFSKDEEILEKAKDLHLNATEPVESNRTLGGFYNYPECCVQYFIDNLQHKLEEKKKNKNYDLMQETILGVKGDELPYWLNTFPGGNKFFFHLTCSYEGCKKTREIAERNSELMKKYDLADWERMRGGNLTTLKLEDGREIRFV